MEDGCSEVGLLGQSTAIAGAISDRILLCGMPQRLLRDHSCWRSRWRPSRREDGAVETYYALLRGCSPAAAPEVAGLRESPFISRLMAAT